MTASTSQSPPRIQALGTRSPTAGDVLPSLVDMAQQGLRRMHRDHGTAVAHTLRGVRSPNGTMLKQEGNSLRYAAIVALGLARLTEKAQREVLDGSTVAELTARTAKRAYGDPDPGAAALAAWAAAEATARFEPGLFDQLSAVMNSDEPVATVDTAWILTAALAARSLGETTELQRLAADRLAAAQGPGALFPHTLPPKASGRLRAHVGCFADQIYPIQAFARLAAATNDQGALRIADQCAATICALQGRAGQWWWHYDARTGEVIEGYPVYSVHQHAMAPMALFDLIDAGGRDHTTEIAHGFDWLYTHPEVLGELISGRHQVVWRKVGRREPPKAVRSISAVSTAVRPGLRVPALDRIFPPGQIDYECRPYELGWLIYAWLASTEVAGE